MIGLSVIGLVMFFAVARRRSDELCESLEMEGKIFSASAFRSKFVVFSVFMVFLLISKVVYGLMLYMQSRSI